MFVQPSLTKCMMSLAQHLKTKQKEVGVNRCLFVAVIVARCIEFLHDRDVSTENLSLENIYLRPSKVMIFLITITVSPQMKLNMNTLTLCGFMELIFAMLKFSSRPLLGIRPPPETPPPPSAHVHVAKDEI